MSTAMRSETGRAGASAARPASGSDALRACQSASTSSKACGSASLLRAQHHPARPRRRGPGGHRLARRAGVAGGRWRGGRSTQSGTSRPWAMRCAAARSETGPCHPSLRKGGEMARWTCMDAAPEAKRAANVTGKDSTAASSVSRMTARNARRTARPPSRVGGPSGTSTPASMRRAHQEGTGSGTSAFSAEGPWALAGTSTGICASHRVAPVGERRPEHRLRRLLGELERGAHGRQQRVDGELRLSGLDRSRASSGEPRRRTPRSTEPAARRRASVSGSTSRPPQRR